MEPEFYECGKCHHHWHRELDRFTRKGSRPVCPRCASKDQKPDTARAEAYRKDAYGFIGDLIVGPKTPPPVVEHVGPAAVLHRYCYCGRVHVEEDRWKECRYYTDPPEGQPPNKDGESHFYGPLKNVTIHHPVGCCVGVNVTEDDHREFHVYHYEVVYCACKETYQTEEGWAAQCLSSDVDDDHHKWHRLAPETCTVHSYEEPTP